MKGAQESNEVMQILSSSQGSCDNFLQAVKLYASAEQRIDCIEMSKFASKTKGINHETALALAKARLEAIRRLGFNGIRIFTLANDYLDYTTAEAVLQFEKQLGQNFPLPITGICAYDLTCAQGKWDRVLLDLLKAHGAHVFKGIAGSDRDAEN
jgi:sugar phosphate isomerase/epimerase